MIFIVDLSTASMTASNQNELILSDQAKDDLENSGRISKSTRQVRLSKLKWKNYHIKHVIVQWPIIKNQKEKKKSSTKIWN